MKPVTLRAWQRRYNLIEPERTEKGHRLYTQQHIDLINEIQGWLAKGVSIGKVKALLGSEEPLTSEDADDNGQLDDVEPVLDALAELNKGKAETLIHSVLKEYPLNVVETQFIQPVMQALSLVRQSLRSLQCGLFHTLMLTKLNAIIEAENKAARSGKALFICVQGSTDVESRLMALSLVEKGSKVTLIDEVDDLSGLLAHPNLDEFSTLAIYSARAVSEPQLSAIKQLEAVFSGELVLPDLLRRLKG